MKSLVYALVTLTLAALLPSSVTAQTARPVPYPVFEPPQLQRAIENGTRTRSGLPGPNYWQNEAAYTINATLDIETNTLRAEGTIRYRNNAPNELPFLVLKLRQNVHKEGVPRNRYVEITGGLTLTNLRVNGAPMEEVTEGSPEAGQYRIIGTILTLQPPEPVATGDEVELAMEWAYRIPSNTGSFRQGQDGEVYYIAYWYPQMAVYDDVYGWHSDQYLGMGEHYMGFADYDVRITAPEGMLVWGTGDLQNAETILTPETRDRLARATAQDEIVHIVTADERLPGGSTLDSPADEHTWHWRAERTRDFAFGASDRYIWDATRALVDQDGDGTDESVLINAFYRPDAAAWGRAAEFARFSIEHLSGLLFPYPYPHMTAVEGLIGGGMEFPMMTLIGGTRSDQSLFSVAYHEISHMWFPMVVGQNEKRFTWMDEGLTSYNTNVGITDFFDGSAENRPEVDGWARNRQFHFFLAGTGFAVEPMRHNDLFPLGGGTQQVDPVGNASRGVASYSTPAVLLRAIEGMYGTDRFLEAYRAYGRQWSFKHPYPWDLFNTFEDVLGDDLDWLWTPTLFDTWTPDQAVASVESTASGVKVTVEDRGLAPMPAPVHVTYADGREEAQTIPVDTWLAGAREASVTFPAGPVTRVEIDPGDFMLDVDRTNNVWESEQAVNSSD